MSPDPSDPANFSVLKEGAARLRIPANNAVFYNNVQNVNRDLSVLALDAFMEQREAEVRAKEEGKAEARPGWRKMIPTWTEWGQRDLDAAIQRVKEETMAARETSGRAGKDKDKDAAAAAAGDDADDAAAAQQAQKEPALDLDAGPTRVLEALAATGLRTIRYAKEIDRAMIITANDLEPAAAESIRSNVAANEPFPNGTRVIATHGDCVDVMTLERPMRAHPGKLGFHVVDLDPYGTPCEFLDSAVKVITNGGLLCVTATDLAVLLGKYPERCMAKYGSSAAAYPYGHELAVRVLLNAIDAAANRSGRYIVPLLSLKIDFYVRVFVRVYQGQVDVKAASRRRALVYQAAACDSFHVVPMMVAANASPDDDITMRAKGDLYKCGRVSHLPVKCPDSDSDWVVFGPIWSAPLHNNAFIDALLARLRAPPPSMRLKFAERVKGMLHAARAELPDVPLYYSTASLTRTLHCMPAPLERMQAAVVNAGYRVSQSHDDPQALKTDAPPSVVWDIMRCWIEKHPVHEARIDPHSPGTKILSKKPTLKANFDPPQAVRDARRKRPLGLTTQGNPAHKKDKKDEERPKWLPNPERNWGPKSRAHGRVESHAGSGAATTPASSASGSGAGGDASKKKE